MILLHFDTLLSAIIITTIINTSSVSDVTSFGHGVFWWHAMDRLQILTGRIVNTSSKHPSLSSLAA